MRRRQLFFQKDEQTQTPTTEEDIFTPEIGEEVAADAEAVSGRAEAKEFFNLAGGDFRGPGGATRAAAALRQQKKAIEAGQELKLDIPVVPEGENLPEKPKEQEITNEGLANFVNQISQKLKRFKGADDATVNQLKRLIGSIQAETVDANLESFIRRQDLIRDMRQKIKRDVLDQYFNANGLDYDNIRTLVENQTTKGKVTTTALDELRAKGPEQMAMPEIPNRDKVMISKTIASVMGSMMKSAFTSAAGGRTAQVAGLMPDPGLQALADTGRMLATDVEKFQAKQEKVEQVNFMARNKWQNQITQMQADIDRRLDASELEYQRNIERSIANHINRADRYYALDQQLASQVAGLETQKELAEVGIEKFNVQQKNAAKRLKTQLAINLKMGELKARQATRKKNMPYLFDIVKRNAPLAEAIGLDTTQAEAIMDQVVASSLPENVRGAIISRSNQMFRSMKDAELSNEQQKIYINNVLKLSTQDFIPRSFTRETMQILSEKPIDMVAIKGNIMAIGDERLKASITRGNGIGGWFGYGTLLNVSSAVQVADKNVNKKDSDLNERIEQLNEGTMSNLVQ